jgi:hypothetical protein
MFYLFILHSLVIPYKNMWCRYICIAIVNNILLIIIPDKKKSNMGKKRKLEDREIKKTVSREKLLKISQRKLSKVKRLKYLLHRCAKTIYNTLKLNMKS